jgi:hypothetical protein
LTSVDQTALSPDLALRCAMTLAAPRVAHHLRVPRERAPLAVQHALGLLMATLAVSPDGQVFDRRSIHWPPHRPRGTVRRSSGQPKRLAARIKKAADGLRLSVVNGRVEYAERVSLVGAKGLR